MSRSAVEVLAGELPGIAVAPLAGPRLLQDYLAGEPAAAPFYGGHPADPAAYRRKAAEVDARLDARSRQRLALSFRPLGSSAERKLQQVLAGRGYFVTTGQQTGLFTGPLYTIYKALSAIRLAASLEALLGRPVLALFWSAADDHDWDEVSHVTVLDAAGYPLRIALGSRADDVPHSMSGRFLDGSAGLAIDQLRELLPATIFRDGYVQRLRAAYAAGRTMADAFEDALAAALEGQEIALVSSSHPLVKQHAAPILRAALEQAARDERLIAGQTERLLLGGYHAQVSVAPATSNVFFSDGQGRDRLVRERGRWVLRRSRRTMGDEEVRSRLATEPASFSPNVLLRPVVESALFPTLAYVGGPAETSYFAQIGCLFLAHGIMPPVMYPRHSVTLVEPSTARALSKFDMELAQLRQPLETLLDGVVRRDLPLDVMRELERLRSGIALGFEALAAAAERVAPGISVVLAGERRQALGRVAALEKRIVRHARRAQAARLEQLRRAATLVQPNGAAQERTLNTFHFLARYGPELIGRLLAAFKVEIGANHPEFAGVNCGGGLPPRQ